MSAPFHRQKQKTSEQGKEAIRTEKKNDLIADVSSEGEIAKRYERYRGIIKNFTLMSDTFMRNVFKHIECVEYVLQVIMTKDMMLRFSKRTRERRPGDRGIIADLLI